MVNEAGAPPGVLNVVLGDGRVGELLARHAGVHLVSVTGSEETGRKVMRAATESLKRLVLELGGKSPLIVCNDCDLAQAVDGAMMANFTTQGEVCSHATRVYVQSGIYRDFVHRLTQRCTRGIRIGDPLLPRTNVGPLITDAQRQRVLRLIEAGTKGGARVLVGGPVEPVLHHGPDVGRNVTKGYFVQPTVLENCPETAAPASEEIFGPVMCLFPFHDDEEAVKRANASRFGLAAGVFTQSLNRAHTIASALRAGYCWINNYNVGPIELPFGGVKHSGMGVEYGAEAVAHYTQSKSIYVDISDGVRSAFTD